LLFLFIETATVLLIFSGTISRRGSGSRQHSLHRRLARSTMAGMSQPSPTPETARGLFVGRVIKNEPLCRDHYLLRALMPGFPPTRPGQFVQVQCRHMGPQQGYREVAWPDGGMPRLSQPELAGREPLLRRPLSLAGRRDTAGGAELSLIYRAIGIGTHWLAGAREGAPLSMLGPLGNVFPISAKKRHAFTVGGGVGIPPMLYLAEALARSLKTVVAFNGARKRDLLPLTLDAGCPPCQDGSARPCVKEFADRGAASVVATDDGSAGFRGLLSTALERRLDRGDIDAGDLVVYTCGPEGLMRAVGGACMARGIECHVAMERHMACGVGACQSCICKTRAENERGWEFRLCCTDGPVFDAAQIVW
jgi:dihydroorotate dehydrogenase electron transfer subunit